ncbi:MAG: 3D-(3,5/4)-trihydroxycyclohexane-1,2-dione acylhydrolase (decyclizing) [Johnsonella sp.]|nr:3D-(3,5/4)-trihydroxycyclohexane-1,2-dione acylhydrolase (decyclizing) [Johnsonella sp.]
MSEMRMTVGQAIVKFLSRQYLSVDGKEEKFVEGIFTIFGHGNVVGLGQALDEDPCGLRVYQGRNEQGMAHAATAFAKQHNREKIIAVTSSVGPGAANMVTAAATATVNCIPLLLFPGDVFATRQPDPVLQQLEVNQSLSISTNDAFRPVCRYFDRIDRSEKLMSAMIQAMRVLTSPADTGAVCIALPQDVQGESYDFPESFFAKRVHLIRRPEPVKEELDAAVEAIKSSKRPMLICGGGVRYSKAGELLSKMAEKYGIAFAETQAGKSAAKSSCPWNLGGIGVTGNSAANKAANRADLIISVGSRMSDFTTSSKSGFLDADLVSINISDFHAAKMDAIQVVADAGAALRKIDSALAAAGYQSQWGEEAFGYKKEWEETYRKLGEYHYTENFEPIVKFRNEGSIEEFIRLTQGKITQTSAIVKIREKIDSDAVICGASGSLPGCLQRMWTTDAVDSYHMEYGYSCMGYEIAAALGAKLADPSKEVYAMVGDGSFQMLHSEFATSLMERKKINILLFDNCGFGCINNLQMSNGIGNLATEFRYRNEEGRLEGGLVPVDYAKIAEGYGAKSYTVKSLDELEAALADSKKQECSTLIDIKVLPKTMTGGYGAWWHVGIAGSSAKESVNKAYEDKESNLKKARKY